MKKLLLLLTLLTQQVFATEIYDTYIFGGKLYEITSISEGLLIRLENNTQPLSCPKNNYGWMLIPQSSKAILSVTLAHWYQKKRSVDIYVEPYIGTGYCRVSQVHPR